MGKPYDDEAERQQPLKADTVKAEIAIKPGTEAAPLLHPKGGIIFSGHTHHDWRGQ